jgi:hypothetical protein
MYTLSYQRDSTMSAPITPPTRTASPGPKPRQPKGGKGATVLARVTQELKDALVEESERTGQSISHIAEAWMWEAHQGRAGLVEKLGGLEVASTVSALIGAANTIRHDFDVPLSTEAGQRLLKTAWRRIIDSTLSPWPLMSAELIGVVLAKRRVTEAREALEAAGGDDHDARRYLDGAMAILEQREALLEQYENDLLKKADALFSALGLND